MVAAEVFVLQAERVGYETPSLLIAVWDAVLV
jgi:hypothetical protein